jgi:NADPH:quinone reductase-like Zn-dependent oxidoreductase
MKAAVCRRYGPPEVLELVELPPPTPRANEVRIRVRATTVTSGDCRVRAFNLPRGFGVLGRLGLGFSGPRQPVLGTELAGEVDAIGASVTRFRVGDPVFAFPGAAMGGYAEQVCVAEDGLVVAAPAGVELAHAAALSFGGTTALDFLRRAAVQPGERVLINGASGGVGTAMVQLARRAGAEVTAVCSEANAALVRELGAAEVIDYRRVDFAGLGRQWDVVADVVGTAPYARSLPVLAPGGRLLQVLAPLGELLAAPWRSWTSGRRVIAGPVAERREDLEELASLAASGALRVVVDRIFPFAELAAAHRYVDEGHKVGNVVVLLEG